jgi:hypothetical protein
LEIDKFIHHQWEKVKLQWKNKKKGNAVDEIKNLSDQILNQLN